MKNLKTTLLYGTVVFCIYTGLEPSFGCITTPVLNMNEKVTTSYTIAHTVSGTVLVGILDSARSLKFLACEAETFQLPMKCYSPYKTTINI